MLVVKIPRVGAHMDESQVLYRGSPNTLAAVCHGSDPLHKGRISLRCPVTFIYNLCALFILYNAELGSVSMSRHGPQWMKR